MDRFIRYGSNLIPGPEINLQKRDRCGQSCKAQRELEASTVGETQISSFAIATPWYLLLALLAYRDGSRRRRRVKPRLAKHRPIHFLKSTTFSHVPG
jgi:hypothetical protein